MEKFIDIADNKLNELKIERDRLRRIYPVDDGYFLEAKINKGKYYQLYKCKTMTGPGRNKVSRTFIKKSELSIAKQLAQKDFDIQLLKLLDNQIDVLEKMIEEYPIQSGEDIYKNQSDIRKSLIESKYEDKEKFTEAWKKSFMKKEKDLYDDKYPIETPYYTDNGEHVRSKSEKIIADKLEKEGIPYVYEPAHELNKTGIHPDFVVLNINTRKTFVYEHFGMMDRPEYAVAAIRKIEKYRKLGYEYGENFLYTFETGENGFDTMNLEMIINKYWNS
ncbi:MAG: hypothetical protein K6E79_01580 [Pseudobutyrivibrio sp.]|nr:hypothetical protein [Pseudobutyrivibrio sp.]